MATPSQLSDLDRARLFLRALNSYTMAEAALRRRQKLKPALHSLMDRLASQWERTQTQARRAHPQEAARILREFMEALDERMVQGQQDLQERHARGKRVGSLFLAWGLFYLFKTKALDLAEGLAGGLPTEAEGGPGQKDPATLKPSAPDTAALREFQMALDTGP